jgi:alkanesulfonate monooxygenase SsuD/methylene tetrahydromethanopterin reductase-like flavin-dependent oxidoreductase (luciferase family)
MSTPVQFGWLSPVIGNKWSDFQPIVVHQAEHILPTVNDTFDSVWVADHFYGFDARTDPFMEAWTTLTWLAAKFDKLQLCHHVLGVGYRPPALTAKMAATLQVLSKNRFILGIGAGWREDEYAAYGYDFPKASVRFAQLEETIEICRLMWSDPSPTYSGAHFSIDDAAAPPLPDVAPPICIGASGEKVGLPLVGRQADIWNTFIRSNDGWRHKRDIVDAAAQAAGRDPHAIVSCTTVEKPLPETDAESAALLDLLGGLRDLGITYFVMDFGHPKATEPIHRFVTQVMNQLR